MYVTINDIVLNAGTEHEQRRPFEIFINSKNMDHFQWIVALTRLMSAVFRKGGDVTFLAEELQACSIARRYFNPAASSCRRSSPRSARLSSTTCRNRLDEKEELSEQQQLILDQKRAQAEAAEQKKTADRKSDSSYPASATLCNKCHNQGRRDHGQLRDLPVLRLFEVRVRRRPRRDVLAAFTLDRPAPAAVLLSVVAPVPR